MKITSIILLISSTFAACQKQGAPPHPAIADGQPFELALKQTATLPAGSGGPASLTLTAVEDSRCPIGMQCIWAGYVAVTLALTDDAAPAQPVRISLHFKDLTRYSADSAAVTLNQKSYWLRLLDVTPYPSRTGSDRATTATLRLRPR